MKKDYSGLTRAELDSLLADKLESMLAYLKDQTTYPSGTYFTYWDKNYEELVYVYLHKPWVYSTWNC